LVGSELRLNRAEDLPADVRVLAQERRRVLATLSEPLVVEREVRTGLLDDLALEGRVEDRLPIASTPSFNVSMRRMSSRTDA
jgi:hypothetical protein